MNTQHKTHYKQFSGIKNMSKKYDVVYGEKYTTPQGEEKTKWINCGAVIQTKNGFALKLESIPVNFNGWFSLFEPKPREQNRIPEQHSSAIPGNDDFNDSIPF